MNQSKKYYSISEVSHILGIKPHNLRYAEGNLGSKLTIIRGRRHYKSSDIETIRAYFAQNVGLAGGDMSAIDRLIWALQSLRAELVLGQK